MKTFNPEEFWGNTLKLVWFLNRFEGKKYNWQLFLFFFPAVLFLVYLALAVAITIIPLLLWDLIAWLPKKSKEGNKRRII